MDNQNKKVKQSIDWFWDYRDVFASDLSAHAKLVRLCLAMHADHVSRTVYQSLTLIATECGISRASVIRSLKELEEKGWISVTYKSEQMNKEEIKVCLK